jgi:RHS repeat-associated protein
MAMLNPCGWSSKITDRETGLVYYGYRYYNPVMGRWIGRDSAGEMKGGNNLFGFCGNNGVCAIDGNGKLIIGFFVGAVYGGVTAYIACVDAGGNRRDQLYAVLEGAGVGGLCGAVDPSEGLATVMAAGAVGGAAADVFGQIQGTYNSPDGPHVSPSQVLVCGVGGALGGYLGQVISAYRFCAFSDALFGGGIGTAAGMASSAIGDASAHFMDDAIAIDDL